MTFLFNANRKLGLAAVLAFGLSAGTLRAHSIQICKTSDPAAPVTGSFTFTITETNFTTSVQAGQCSTPVFLAPGTYTVTEGATSGTTVTFISATPSEALTGSNTGNRTATVLVTETFQTIVTFTNRVRTGTQGCTPGFFKNHLSAFTSPYTPTTEVGTVFSGFATTGFATETLLDALQGDGGPDLAGAEQILLRAAVAALLNAANPSVSYALTVSEITSLVNTAVASGDRSTILSLASRLDAFNNGSGGCPLS
jgi:hypothetical protein